MKLELVWLCAVLFLALAQAQTPRVIVLVADGWGAEQIRAVDFYQHGAAGTAAYESFPVRLYMSTFSASGDGYSPQKAAQDATYVLLKPTDSAASGTALATGAKTYNGSLGVGTGGEALYNIAEVAHDLGKSAGVVTSVPFAHATPAAMVVHQASRTVYATIAPAMLATDLDVIMGAGHPWFDDNGVAVATPDYTWVGDAATWNGLVAGSAGGTRPWVLLDSLKQFVNLAAGVGTVPTRVVGVAPVRATLQQKRTLGAASLSAVPDLATMALGALRVLNQNAKGYFLLVEGGAVDWASHANQSDRLVEEMASFNVAVDSVVAWIERNGGWETHLLVVTGDHETGFLQVDANLGKGMVPTMTWKTTSHTNQLIPIYAKGLGSERIGLAVVGTDSLRGKYTDNARVGGLLHEILGGPAVSVTKFPPSYGRRAAKESKGKDVDLLGRAVFSAPMR